jgi:hypothetical protein
MNIITKNARKVAQGTALAVMALTTLAPIAANADPWRPTHPVGPAWDYRHDGGDRDSRWQDRRSQDDSLQNNKNNMRNLAIGAGAVAVYGLLNHNTLATVLGAAGAAVAGSQYEKDRQQQSQDNSDWRYHRHW